MNKELKEFMQRRFPAGSRIKIDWTIVNKVDKKREKRSQRGIEKGWGKEIRRRVRTIKIVKMDILKN